jgi:hypothetical protein
MPPERRAGEPDPLSNLTVWVEEVLVRTPVRLRYDSLRLSITHIFVGGGKIG